MEKGKAKRAAGKAAKAKPDVAQSKRRKPSSRPILITLIAVVIAVVIFTALFYGLYYGGTTSFPTFQRNFNSAKEVAIYLNYSDAGSFPNVVSCSSALIQELSGPTLAHRNSTTINLFVLYNDSCVYKQGGLGTVAKNYTYATREQCLNYSKSMPSIFIAYGAANETLITPDRLYFIGDSRFIMECGIAYEIT